LEYRKKVLVAHPGTQYSHQLVKQLEKNDLLLCFITCGVICEHTTLWWFFKVMPRFFKRKVKNRIISDVPIKKVKSFFWLELLTHVKLYFNSDSESVVYWRNEIFQKIIPERLILEADVIIGFDTSSWILVDRCKKHNKKFILDVSIAHSVEKSRVYEQICSSYPSWKFSIIKKNNRHLEFEQLELDRSHKIVVASDFTRKSLVANNVENARIVMNQYGVDFSQKIRSEKVKKTIDFVFLGSVDARKGIPLLLDVWDNFLLKNVSLTLIGPISNDVREMVQRRNENIIILGKVPAEEVFQRLSNYDVLVFPSYFEGFGLVILEAMMCGLPVITTDATCGAEIIDNGVDGLVISAGDKSALTAAISSFVDNKFDLSEMSVNARRKSLEYSWNNYGSRWLNLVDAI
jgi:glycosyltransferase involved in cell wall biosynthesis